MALTDNLVAAWEFEETSGGANDSHGSNHLSEVGTVGTGAGKVGNAREFDGDTDRLEIADNAALSMGDIAFTIELWFRKASSSGTRMIFLKQSGAFTSAAAFEYGVYLNGADQLQFVVSDGSSFTIVAEESFLSDDTYYQALVSHDPDTNLISVALNNGTPVTAAHSTGVWDSNGDLTIGGDDPVEGRSFTGRIDNFRIWKRLLTTDEKTFLYNSGDGRSYAQLSSGASVVRARIAAYYRMMNANN